MNSQTFYPMGLPLEHEEDALQANVPLEFAGERLDWVAAQLFSEYSRGRLQTWIEAARLTVDGVARPVKSKLHGGELLTLSPTLDDETLAFTPEPVAFPVLHEDESLIVIDKPAGLVVHPAAGHWQGTLLNGLLHRYPELMHVPRAGIVHRLDKDTTGLMVVARMLEAQTALVRQLQARSVSRRYFALCWGQVADQTIDQTLGRDPRERIKMAVVANHQANGKSAVTHVRFMASGVLNGHAVSLVECQLETGRTHQIRVHLSYLGHALVGDALYASRAQTRWHPFPRQALHAHSLGFQHPSHLQAVQFSSHVPEDFLSLLGEAQIQKASLQALQMQAAQTHYSALS